MTTQDKTREAIEIVEKTRKARIPHYRFDEALQHLIQIAERAGDKEGIEDFLEQQRYTYDKSGESIKETPSFILAQSLSKWLRGEK